MHDEWLVDTVSMSPEGITALMASSTGFRLFSVGLSNLNVLSVPERIHLILRCKISMTSLPNFRKTRTKNFHIFNTEFDYTADSGQVVEYMRPAIDDVHFPTAMG